MAALPFLIASKFGNDEIEFMSAVLTLNYPWMRECIKNAIMIYCMRVFCFFLYSFLSFLYCLFFMTALTLIYPWMREGIKMQA